jgi:hypothetical protein
MSAEEQSDESKHEQQKDWHVSDCFYPSPLSINLLRADRILAKHTVADSLLIAHHTSRLRLVSLPPGYASRILIVPG